MRLDPSLDRLAEIKREVIDVALSPRNVRWLHRFLREDPVAEIVDDTTAVDRFIMEHRWPDGRTLVDRFLGERPDITGAEREHLLGWHDVVHGVFEVRSRDGDRLHTHNVIDELPYTLVSNVGSGLLDQIPDDAFLVGRAVPHGDVWVLSATLRIVPAASRHAAYADAVDLLTASPRLAIRNPELLRAAVVNAAKTHLRFVEHFGSDLVVLSAHDAPAAIAGLLRAGGDPDPAAGAESMLSPIDDDAETIGLASDELKGMDVLKDLGLVVEAFENPRLAHGRRHRRVLKGYLEDGSVSAFPVVLLAERDREKATAVFRAITGRPRFRWDRDGAALLDEHKPGFDSADPGVTTVGDTLAAYLRDRS